MCTTYKYDTRGSVRIHLDRRPYRHVEQSGRQFRNEGNLCSVSNGDIIQLSDSLGVYVDNDKDS
jgi:hypothetical protein